MTTGPAVKLYPFGSLVRCSTTFQRVEDNAAYDPITVTFRYRNPAGTIVALVHGVDLAVVRDGLGLYHCDVNANATGTWWYDWKGDNPQAENQQRFLVDQTMFG